MLVTQEVFCTSVVPAHERTTVWEMYSRERAVAMRLNALGGDEMTFHLKRTIFSDFELMEMEGDAYLAERTPALIAAAPAHMLQIGILLRGHSFMHTSRRADVLERGDAIFYDTESPCVYGVSDGYREAAISAPRAFFDERYGNLGPSEPTIMHASSPDQLAWRVERLLDLAHTDLSHDPPAATALEAALLRLLDDLLGQARPNGGHWLEAREYIRRNYRDSRLSVSDVARAVGKSERQISRVFASQGITITRVIAQERMRVARQRLVDPTRTVTVSGLAREVGFTSAAQFARAFKQWHELSPQDFRALEMRQDADAG